MKEIGNERGKWNGVEQSTTPFQMDLTEKEKETEICPERRIGTLHSTPKPYPMSQKLATAVTHTLSNSPSQDSLRFSLQSLSSACPFSIITHSFLYIPTFVTRFSPFSYGCRPGSLDPFSYAQWAYHAKQERGEDKQTWNLRGSTDCKLKEQLLPNMIPL